jgi:hypothetical protein
VTQITKASAAPIYVSLSAVPSLGRFRTLAAECTTASGRPHAAPTLSADQEIIAIAHFDGLDSRFLMRSHRVSVAPDAIEHAVILATIKEARAP